MMIGTLFEQITPVAVAVGSVLLVSKLAHVLSLAWVYIKPSSLPRYAHKKDGKSSWALITGATGGIGKELSHEFALRGFNVVLHGRTLSKLEQLQDELSKAHPDRSFRTLVFDASKAVDDPNRLSADLASALGDIHLTTVVNNAGGSTERTFGPLEKMAPKRMVGDASVNAIFPTLLLQAAIPLLKQNAPGLIINIGSMADIGLPYSGTYSSSKMFLSTLSEAIDTEMRLKGADVEIMCIRVGNVWGTNQTIAPAPNLLAPNAATMARAVLARVGCGRSIVVGYWAHALQYEFFTMLPGFVFRQVLMNISRDLDTTESDKKKQG